MFQYSFHTRNGKTRYRGLLKHRVHAYSRCMWMNLRRMVIFQISTFQRSIFALFGPIREAFGSFMAISRKIFTCEADCYVSFRMTTLVRLNSKYAHFQSGLNSFWPNFENIIHLHNFSVFWSNRFFSYCITQPYKITITYFLILKSATIIQYTIKGRFMSR